MRGRGTPGLRSASSQAMASRGRHVALLLHRAQELHVARGGREGGRVGVEPTIEARRGGLEDHRRHEGGGHEARLLQGLGEEGHLGQDRGRDVVAHPGLRGQEAREEGHVRRPGQGDVGGGLFGHRALGRDAVEVGGGHVLVAVHAQPVGAQGVDGHEDEMAGRWRLSRAAGGTGRQEQQDDGDTALPPLRAFAAAPLVPPCVSVPLWLLSVVDGYPPRCSLSAAATSRWASASRPWRL